MIITARSFVIL